ncbi:MAG: response regulator [Vicinamibacterales bacterium]
MRAAHRILVADDHAVVRFGLRAILEAQPDLHVVAEAADGHEALARFLELRPDVGILDMVLPGMDGAAVCEAIRREVPRARLLIVSGAAPSEHVHRALKAGAQGYLLKDAAPSALVSAVRSVIAGRRVVPPHVAHELAERAYQPDLSPREHAVLALIVEGLSNKEIAARLAVAEATVKTHVAHVLGKLGVEDRTQAALAAVTRGIVAPR